MKKSVFVIFILITASIFIFHDVNEEYHHLDINLDGKVSLEELDRHSELGLKIQINEDGLVCQSYYSYVDETVFQKQCNHTEFSLF